MQRRAVFLLMILMIPLLSGIISPHHGLASAAIDDCKGDLSPIVWNETISRHAEVPHNSQWSAFFEEDWDDGEGKGRASEPIELNANVDLSLSPEESWMYQSYHSPMPVETLTTNIATTMLIGNDSVEPCESIFRTPIEQRFALKFRALWTIQLYLRMQTSIS